ncbi:hypothetical protein MMC10_005925 [Thelotrema lepadinum]|nr:hypothetical protein [Thelotrema lepadinum]
MYSGNATGNVELLSEGRPGIDPLYSLRQGLNFTVLTHVNVYLISLRRPPTRATKTPLRARWPTGKADTGWRKKASEEQILLSGIELNLRLPSMISGKKGFERIKWAFKNVLNEPVAWLFRDCNQSQDPTSSDNEGIPPLPSLNFSPSLLPTQNPSSPSSTHDHLAVPGPLKSHHPTLISPTPTTTSHSHVFVPPLSFPQPLASTSTQPPTQYTRDESALDILEFLGLLTLSSPRIEADDDVDPYLCRSSTLDQESATSQDIVILRWRGFISESWVRGVFALCWANLVDEEEAWFALSAVAFRTEAVEGRDGFVVLMPPRGSSTAIGEDERSGEEGGGEMDVDDGVDEEGEGKETGVVKREPEGQREFLLWEMVNCVDGR